MKAGKVDVAPVEVKPNISFWGDLIIIEVKYGIRLMNILNLCGGMGLLWFRNWRSEDFLSPSQESYRLWITPLLSFRFYFGKPLRIQFEEGGKLVTTWKLTKEDGFTTADETDQSEETLQSITNLIWKNVKIVKKLKKIFKKN